MKKTKTKTESTQPLKKPDSKKQAVQKKPFIQELVEHRNQQIETPHMHEDIQKIVENKKPVEKIIEQQTNKEPLSHTKQKHNKIHAILSGVFKRKKKKEYFLTQSISVRPNIPTEEELRKQIPLIDTTDIEHKKYEYLHEPTSLAPDQQKLQEKVFHYDFSNLEKTDSLILSIDNVYKRFGRKQAVNGVSFDIKTGEVVGFLGPNGAGKTTVFYMIVGFLTPDNGRILFNDVNIEKLPMYKRAKLGISYLPQEPSVFRRLSVEKNIIAVLQTIKGISDDERKNRLEHLIAEFGLESYRKQKAYTLSGGERRRTEIARGMALHPYFLLLDEPFTGIDPKARYELKQIILALSRKGVGVLITDHNERDTLSITDRAFILHNGDIVAEGSREDIINNVKAREIYLGEDYS